MRPLVAFVLIATLAAPGCAMPARSVMHMTAPAPQVPADTTAITEAWRTFVSKLPPGARVKVTLRGGRRVSATLLQSTADAILISPRTRIPEPVMTVRFADLAAIDLEQEGASTARAVGIGIAAGAGAFLSVLLILIASID